MVLPLVQSLQNLKVWVHFPYGRAMAKIKIQNNQGAKTVPTINVFVSLKLKIKWMFPKKIQYDNTDIYIYTQLIVSSATKKKLKKNLHN